MQSYIELSGTENETILLNPITEEIYKKYCFLLSDIVHHDLLHLCDQKKNLNNNNNGNELFKKVIFIKTFLIVGPGGSGKSLFLKKMYQKMQLKKNKCFAV